MALHILRGVFVLLAATVTVLYVLPFQTYHEIAFGRVLLMIGFAVGGTGVIVAADIFWRHKKLSTITGMFLGLIVGLLGAYALSFVVDLIGLLVVSRDRGHDEAVMNLLGGVKILIGVVTCYLGSSFVLQTKDDFRFVLPYVEFAKQVRGSLPTLLDTSVMIDGRISDIARTFILQGQLVVPQFVLDELNDVADSSDVLRRARARRGLDTLRRLQTGPYVDVQIDQTDARGSTADQKVVSLAQQIKARVMTNDVNVNKIASLRGVEVINLNDLASALRPALLPGESVTVKLIKPGEGADQGVGYLEDGTMVVVEHGRRHVGSQIPVKVTSTLQTSAGRMVFGRPGGAGNGNDLRASTAQCAQPD